MRRPFSLTPLLALLCCLAGALPAAPAQAAESYTLSVPPVLPATEIKRRWQPVLDYLNRSTGDRFQFLFHENGLLFQQSLQNGAGDFVILGPMQTWQARQRYRPILRDGHAMHAMVVVHKDSPINSLADLHEKRLAVPEIQDLAAGIVIRQQLKQAGIAPKLQPMRTHGSGFRAVLIGKADAAAGDSLNYSLQSPDMLAKLKVIYRSAAMPSSSFAARRDLPPEVVQRFRDALLNMKDPKLQTSLPLQGLVEADLERDYGMLASLGQEAAPHAP